MIKSLLRFFLLLILCVLLVYAPEIFSSVSPPYSHAVPQRVLLRIALCCNSETAVHLQKGIDTYQKHYPYVHLRITQISEDQLCQLAAPYPDIILCAESLEAQLAVPFDCAVRFAPSPADPAAVCALFQSHAASKAAQEFTAYIKETNADKQSDSQI